MPAALTLDLLNQADHDTFCRLLAGVYEHSPWIAERAWPRRPFATLAALKRALIESVREARLEEQLSLIRAHRPAREDPYRQRVGLIGVEAMLRLYAEPEANRRAFEAIEIGRASCRERV